MQDLKHARNTSLLDNLETSFQKAEEQKNQILSSRVKQHLLSYAREEEAKDKVRRQERAREHLKSKMFMKMDEEGMKLAQKEQEKIALRHEKSKLQREFFLEKERIKTEFEEEKKKLHNQTQDLSIEFPKRQSVFDSRHKRVNSAMRNTIDITNYPKESDLSPIKERKASVTPKRRGPPPAFQTIYSPMRARTLTTTEQSRSPAPKGKKISWFFIFQRGLL